ncbi:O-antigen ligase family protein [Anatilimnocola sp. NA78]|uniref:O-antigen ligase family protein n=1 Tax=Anatilimnocola sp. NA78 TaxID=3415683 RepID=UPI003CE4A81F
MKRRRGPTDEVLAKQPPTSFAAQLIAIFGNYVRPAILALATALLVSTPLVASEGIISEGTGATWHVLWLALALISLAGSALTASPNRRWAWPDLCVVILVGWHVLSAALCDGNERHAWNAAWQWAAYGALAIVMRQQLLTGQETRAVVVVMVLLAAAVALHAYYQYFIGQPALRQEFKNNPQLILDQMGVTAEASGPVLAMAENRINSLEPVAEFALTNSLAGFLLPWMLVSLGLAFWLVQKGESLQTIAVFLVLAVIISGVLVLTKSRTAWLAAAGGCVLILTFGRRSGWQLDWRWPVGISAVVLLLGLAAVAFKGLDAEVLSESPKSVLYRVEYWRATAAMIGDHPWLGVGPGNFQERYAEHKLPQASETVADPHNFLLEVWSTAGTPALLALVALMFTTVWQLARQPRSESTITPAIATADIEPKPFSSFPIGAFAIFIGSFIGLMLAALLGIIVFDPLETTHLSFDSQDTALGLPIMWVTGTICFGFGFYLLRDWIERGELPRSVVVVGLAALLVNLLAAGAAIFPGVMNTAWLLWAIALRPDREEVQPEAIPAEGLSIQSPQQVISLVAAVVCMVALIACNYTEYKPVLAGQHLQMRATAERLREASRPDFVGTPQSISLAEQAIAADPWSPALRRFLANLQFNVWLNKSVPRNWQPFVEAMAAYQQASPHHFNQHQQRGEWLLMASRKTKNKDLLADAAAAYEAAIQCYPNNAFLHAQLASIYSEQGLVEDARKAADEAARLDALCPHVDKKLEKTMLYDPQTTTRTAPTTEEIAAGNAAIVVARLRGVETSPPEQAPDQK